MSNLDITQLKTLSKAEVQAKIVAAGADYHPAESKTDLIGRLLQLQGTAQPIDKLRKELAAQGVTEDGVAPTAAIPAQKKRLTKAEMSKAMKKFIDKGMQFLVSKDGENWAMKFKCEQLRQDNKIVTATRRDTGNTMIPLGVLIQCATTITTVAPIKKKSDVEKDPEGFAPIGDDAEEIAA